MKKNQKIKEIYVFFLSRESFLLTIHISDDKIFIVLEFVQSVNKIPVCSAFNQQINKDGKYYDSCKAEKKDRNSF